MLKISEVDIYSGTSCWSYTLTMMILLVGGMWTINKGLEAVRSLGKVKMVFLLIANGLNWTFFFMSSSTPQKQCAPELEDED